MPKKEKQIPEKDHTKFFLPYASNEQIAEETWQGIRKFAEETTGWPVDENQRIFSLAFTHNGTDYYAEVGKPEPLTGEPVIAILSSATYLICTPNRGVLRGMPILVGYRDTFGIVPFADYKGDPSVDYFSTSTRRRKSRRKTG